MESSDDSRIVHRDHEPAGTPCEGTRPTTARIVAGRVP